MRLAQLVLDDISRLRVADGDEERAVELSKQMARVNPENPNEPLDYPGIVRELVLLRGSVQAAVEYLMVRGIANSNNIAMFVLLARKAVREIARDN